MSLSFFASFWPICLGLNVLKPQNAKMCRETSSTDVLSCDDQYAFEMINAYMSQ